MKQIQHRQRQNETTKQTLKRKRETKKYHPQRKKTGRALTNMNYTDHSASEYEGLSTWDHDENWNDPAGDFDALFR
eukprot:4728199-Ditylum_brightwellii.AAC.1